MMTMGSAIALAVAGVAAAVWLVVLTNRYAELKRLQTRTTEDHGRRLLILETDRRVTRPVVCPSAWDGKTPKTWAEEPVTTFDIGTLEPGQSATCHADGTIIKTPSDDAMPSWAEQAERYEPGPLD